MTPQQKQILDHVRAHWAEHGRGPTQRTIAATLGLASLSRINANLQWLAEHGYLRRTKEGHANYVPAEAGGIDLTAVSTAALLAEVQRRTSEGGRP